MTKKHTNHDADHNLENVESALTRAEVFIEKNQKPITFVLLAILIVAVGYFAYKKFVVAPKAETSIEEIFQAQFYFEQDSFRLALEGDGIRYGFLDIIDNYKSTPAGNLSYYYAGICYLNLGEYDAALKYLKRFKSEDIMIGANAQGLIGDAYLELNDLKNAAKFYEKAAKMGHNDLISPVYLMKAGQVYEMDEQYQKALNVYNRIEKEYYGTREQRNIEKYQTRVKMKMN